MRRSLSCLALLAVCLPSGDPRPLPAQAHARAVTEPVDSLLLRSMTDMLDAVRRRDSATLDALLDPTFVLTSSESTGPLVAKARYIRGSLDPAIVSVTSFRFHDVRVTRVGPVAVVHARLEWHATLRGAPWEGDLLNTDVWVAHEGGWRIVSRHTSYPRAAGRIGT